MLKPCKKPEGVWEVHADAFGKETDEGDKTMSYILFTKENLIKRIYHAWVARSKNRAYWKQRVGKELYENKVIVEDYETNERALLRFLLDGE